MVISIVKTSRMKALLSKIDQLAAENRQLRMENWALNEEVNHLKCAPSRDMENQRLRAIISDQKALVRSVRKKLSGQEAINADLKAENREVRKQLDAEIISSEKQRVESVLSDRVKQKVEDGGARAGRCGDSKLSPLVCSICVGEFRLDNVPKVLKCGHTICESCATNIAGPTEIRVTCPFDRIWTSLDGRGIAGLVKNFMIYEMIEDYEP